MDDNCNGMVDEEMLTNFYFDADDDGYGVNLNSVTACMAPSGHVALGGTAMTARLAVQSIRVPWRSATTSTTNCDGMSDTDMGLLCECTIGVTRSCGQSNVGICRIGTQDCNDGMWSAGCVGGVFPETSSETRCDGRDEDCDGAPDEGLTIACHPDADNDVYRDGDGVTNLCPDSGRAAWGNCPAGYVAPTASRGLDCGLNNNQAYRNDQWYVDGDGDQYCSGTGITCGNGTPPAGYRSSCSGYTDCDPNSASHTWVTVRPDLDNDTFCRFRDFTFCTNGSTPSQYRRIPDCAGDDALDTNNCVTTTASAGPHQSLCFNGPHTCPGSDYCEVLCGHSFYRRVGCTATRQPGSQAGFCTVTNYPDGCRCFRPATDGIAPFVDLILI
ncbi:MAG: hypothetical protein IPG81_27875 [Sandaracinaceae bacterium]|nr:hypothetical protein [Sandaracinaceae bacterium]